VAGAGEALMATVVKQNSSGTWQLTLPDSPLFMPEKLRAVLASVERQHLDLIMQTIAGHLSETSPRDTGHLAQGWQTEVVGGTSGEVVGGRVFNTLPYAIVMDRGRAPGYGISRDGLANLARWVRHKLGLSGREAQSATYAIAWTIRAIIASLAAAYTQAATGGSGRAGAA
jgi:hypothetical protein